MQPSQTRLEALVETLTNVVIGYTINFIMNITVFPWFGYHVTVRDNIVIGLIFTVVSVARSYTIRRYFDTKLRGFNQRMAARLYSLFN